MKVLIDGGLVGAAVVNGAGGWAFTSAVVLGQGLHGVTVQVADAAGNVSAFSVPRSFTVDSISPAAPAVLAPANLALVATATPTISGTAEAGTTVTVLIDGAVAGMAAVNGAGSWAFTPAAALSQGPHGVAAQVSDAAGNASASSIPRSFTVDTLPPAVPVVLSPTNLAEVSTTTPLISGSAEAQSAVAVFIDEALVGRVPVDEMGNWTFTPTVALGQGLHGARAQAADVAGNVSAFSIPRSFTVDTLPPAAPVVLSPASLAMMATTTPAISGTVEAGAAVTVLIDGAVAGTAVVDETGSWTLTPPAALSQGLHAVVAQVEDAVGHVSASAARSFTVDTIPPAAPVVLSPIHLSAMTTSIPVHLGLRGSAERGHDVHGRSRGRKRVGGRGGALGLHPPRWR